jgi:Required for nuclear transport of RNA pol II C-terminus 1/Required for nuclear transport of RNA pol II C-terminus 2
VDLQKAVHSHIPAMADEGSKKNAQPPLVDRILQCGKQAFDPEVSWEERKASVPVFSALLERFVKFLVRNYVLTVLSTSTLALMPVLNLLVQPDRVQPWLRTPLISALARLPLRPRGVQHTIEFILSVHPNSTATNSTPSTGRGSNISHEALNAASRLLSSPPVSMSPEKWFLGIAPQLFSLLEGEGEPEMDKAAAFVVGFGILGRKQFGAPGTPGWKAFVEPILASIDPSVSLVTSLKGRPSNDVETLGSRKVLVSALESRKALQRLSTLLTSHPHPSLTKRLLRPILLPLWSLSFWPDSTENTERYYRKPARNLLRTLLQLSSCAVDSRTAELPNPNLLMIILENLTFTGRSFKNGSCWTYRTAQDGGIQIEEAMRDGLHDGLEKNLDLTRVDIAVDAFLNLLQTLPDMKSDVSDLFINLCLKWLAHSSKDMINKVVISAEPNADENNPHHSFIEAKVMQKMMSTFPEKLVEDSTQVLDLVGQILLDFADRSGNGSEDSVAVALSLLNIVLTSTSFEVGAGNDARLESIQNSLRFISKLQDSEVSSTAQNILLLLKYRRTIEEPVASSVSPPTDRQLEDRKSYSLAMSYLTGTDSPPPVRAQGLELISGLIHNSSPTIDVPALLVLFSSLLQDSEEYIYLRVIKSFIQLSQKHPKAVMKDLIDRYVDPNEECELDQRLRLGEALLQTLESNSLAFSGEIARAVCEGLLFVASRRGHRPKTEHQQEKKNKLKRKQDEEAEKAWGGPVPQLDEALDVKAEVENEILSQIVTGWESKRGSEDVRIRASAISILGSGIETNVSGIDSKILSTAVDLGIHILTLEPAPEKGILRRAAILLIMSFLRALDLARADGRKLGFGFAGKSLQDLQRILAYVEASDNDGLVREHARDVIEGLRALEINSLLPAQKDQTEIQQLAGLSIHPKGEEGLNRRPRPKIEEVE